jgi:hypothetical protein
MAAGSILELALVPAAMVASTKDFRERPAEMVLLTEGVAAAGRALLLAPPPRAGSAAVA